MLIAQFSRSKVAGPARVPAEIGFDELRDAHVAMLTGSLLDGVEPGPDGCGYVWSAAIPDPTLNFAIGVRSVAQAEWAIEAARLRGREPAFLAQDGSETGQLREWLRPEAEFAARWMVAETSAAGSGAGHSEVLTQQAAPSDDFCSVFAALSDDPRICAHVARHYVPSLRSAGAPLDVEPVHFVLHDADGPAACASLYLRAGLAGLYNVSTRADRQRRGLGGRITAAVVAVARQRGAGHVALQCPADGFVEQLYARAGFRTVCSPSLLCLTAPTGDLSDE